MPKTRTHLQFWLSTLLVMLVVTALNAACTRTMTQAATPSYQVQLPIVGIGLEPEPEPDHAEEKKSYDGGSGGSEVSKEKIPWIPVIVILVLFVGGVLLRIAN